MQCNSFFTITWQLVSGLLKMLLHSKAYPYMLVLLHLHFHTLVKVRPLNLYQDHIMRDYLNASFSKPFSICKFTGRQKRRDKGHCTLWKSFKILLFTCICGLWPTYWEFSPVSKLLVWWYIEFYLEGSWMSIKLYCLWCWENSVMPR